MPILRLLLIRQMTATGNFETDGLCFLISRKYTVSSIDRRDQGLASGFVRSS